MTAKTRQVYYYFNQFYHINSKIAQQNLTHYYDSDFLQSVKVISRNISFNNMYFDTSDHFEIYRISSKYLLNYTSRNI